MFFDKKGILNIDEFVVNNESFKKIMEDGIVTEEEIKAQSDKVVALLHDMEKNIAKPSLQRLKSYLSSLACFMLFIIFIQSNH